MLRKWLGRLRRKFSFGVIRTKEFAQLYLTIRGWPFRSRRTEISCVLSETQLRDLMDDNAVKLNVGGGKGHEKQPGWTVVDLRKSADVRMDITQEPLPYRDGTVQVIFTSHTLEHIYPQRLEFVLKEFFRVLEPGKGILRIGVPDIEPAIRAYLSGNYGFFRSCKEISVFDKKAPIGGLLASWLYSTRQFQDVNSSCGEGHVHCFDYDHICYWLKKAGFKDVWRSTYQNSLLPEMRGESFDKHPNETLFVETLKSIDSLLPATQAPIQEEVVA